MTITDAGPDAGQDGGAEVGINARLAALDILASALDRRGGLDNALSDKGFLRLTVGERAFARALAMAVLRNLGRIDRALDAKLRKATPERARNLLRLGAAQLFFMDTPDFAAVSTTVKLAERFAESRAMKGLINAVLRSLGRDGELNAPAGVNAPDWLWRRWIAAYGEPAAEAVAAVIPEEPPTDLTLKDPADATALAVELEAEVLPGGSLRTRRKGDPTEWPGFVEGRWWVQDAAAAVPVRMLAPRPGEAVADLCAAPGGKTLQLAAAGAAVVAVDRSASRLRRLAENLARMDLPAEVIAADAETWDDARGFDAVLLDAPCTSTGTFRRNPDVIWATGAGDLAKLADLQHRLLDSAANRVRPGGRLVYSTCSLEREEGETQITAFLRRRPDFRLDAVDPTSVGAPLESAAPEGWLRILPSHWAERGGVDGFFAARLVRQA
jgi:16S rRNA (cytosine967-C5)-methyltransferase